MGGVIDQAFTWLEATSIASIGRQWAATLAAVHIMGLALSVGMLVWFDLRLLGISLRSVQVSTVYRRLMPWAAAGFVVMAATGGLLMAGFATLVYANPYARLKLAALVLAAVNALVYHVHVEQRIAEWDRDVRTPLLARMAGFISLGLWTVVILAGRLMSYTLVSR